MMTLILSWVFLLCAGIVIGAFVEHRLWVKEWRKREGRLRAANRERWR